MNAGTRPSPCRINVRGAPGAGKTTFATELAARLRLPHIELDSLHWGPNWREPAPESFRAAVRDAMDANPRGWVIDGSYDSKLGDTVLSRADTVIWLDPPLIVIYARLLRRTVSRVVRKVELWNGNRESWRNMFLSRQSLFIWTARSHLRHRRTWPRMFADDARLVRLRSTAEARRWLDERMQERAPIPAARSGISHPVHPDISID